MSTPTSQTEPIVERSSHPTGTRWRRAFLIYQVFIAGAASLSIEFCASRLLAPYFGTSLFVWANIIGLILLYLSVGYAFGGRIADRYPRSLGLYGLTALSSLFILLIPIIATPLMSWLQIQFANVPLAEFYGSLISVLLLFSIPTVLLGCVSPFAIRLRVEQVGSAGRTAGLLYGVSNLGSILGTFLPVLVLMPAIGTANTLYVTGAALLVSSLIGLSVMGR